MRRLLSLLLLACLTALPAAAAGPAKEERKVLTVRDSQTLNGVVPEVGQLYILPPRGYQVMKSKMDRGLKLAFDAAAGIVIQATHPTGSPKGSLTLQFADGRRVTMNVRTQKVSYLNNYLILQ